ncbi:MAG: hypothetical protein CMJ32_07085 [Phycisphaerae bacterium]|nr:hypothetical protein [Phycisphaerae bacterium]
MSNQEQSTQLIKQLLQHHGAGDTDVDTRIISEMIQTSLKLIEDGADRGELKLMNSALKEMRYGYTVFAKYRGVRKISIFGSARTPEDHADYIAAREFSRRIAEHGWMSITGAGDGIMKAGHEGPQREASFGLSIRLPFETSANEFIDGDPKLINFRYFFTRKLMFLSHADAVAVFPGGFGTQDELFESLTLMQTGKSLIVPIVLMEGPGGGYWRQWEEAITKNLLAQGWISPEDLNLYRICDDIEEGVEEIVNFYRRYHSSRYVRDDLVIRLNQPLEKDQIQQLEDEFSILIKNGGIEQGAAHDYESQHLHLPRIWFHHHRHKYGLLRSMINRINEFPMPEQQA